MFHRLRRRVAGLLCLLAASCLPAAAWGPQGHDSIWLLAQERLTPAAKAAVLALTGTNTPDTTAIWLDEVRNAGKGRGMMKNDPGILAFNTNFPKNAEWHYTDLPIGAASYQEARAFAHDEDVVYAIRLAAGVLSGSVTNAMSRPDALRVLVHLVGDIHQPLHCASGFYDLARLSDPVLKRGVKEALPFKELNQADRGGNQLVFRGEAQPHERPPQLHVFWDIDLPRLVAGGLADTNRLVSALRATATSVNASTPGPVSAWPEVWATESLRLATASYEPLRFGRAEKNYKDPATRGVIHSIEISVPNKADYSRQQAEVARRQMTKAALRLAALLNETLK